MISHWQFTNEQFEKKFSDCSFNPSLFTHEAHLRLGFIHIKKYGVSKAIENLCLQIEAFDKTHGDGMKFNKTVTVAALKILHHFMSRFEQKSFSGLIMDYPLLVTDFKMLVSTHYSIDIFNYQLAKTQYLEPDLATF